MVVGVSQLHLAVLWSRIDQRSIDDLGLQLPNLVQGRIEVLDLEPQHDTVTWRRCIGIDKVGTVLLVPA